MDFEELEAIHNKLNRQFSICKKVLAPNQDMKLKVDLGKLEKIL